MTVIGYVVAVVVLAGLSWLLLLHSKVGKLITATEAAHEKLRDHDEAILNNQNNIKKLTPVEPPPIPAELTVTKSVKKPRKKYT